MFTRTNFIQELTVSLHRSDRSTGYHPSTITGKPYAALDPPPIPKVRVSKAPPFSPMLMISDNATTYAAANHLKKLFNSNKGNRMSKSVSSPTNSVVLRRDRYTVSLTNSMSASTEDRTTYIPFKEELC
ncbi:hypothetical protein DPMN_077283 [Dreissena polymorpha]|uniref:Uncharacterized protein n=1 Tax=Dreissena polymorpha TaxID=45954 RepID=A0A9D4BR76_DREPO|nr:hypothetical protein DPMN_077283 [Dreissena polymorpha]